MQSNDSAAAYYSEDFLDVDRWFQDDALLESYLHKCILDPTQALSKCWGAAPLRELIEGYRQGEVYRFPQQVALFQFNS